MKRLINNVLLSAVIGATFVACQSGGSESDTSRTNEQILQAVTEVDAIGKVVPADDWAIIASPVAARIQRLAVQAGDTVTEGQLLVLLESGNADLNVSEARAQLATLQAENRSTIEDVRKAEVHANELKAIYEISQRLLAADAETREKAAADYSSWQQQELVVKGLQQQIKAQQASEKEQTLRIQQAANQLSDFRITAPKAGVVTDFTAQVGQYISGSEELGRIASTNHPVVEAEVDELFANDIHVGQSVYLLAVGRSDTVAQGKIIYTSPILSDKSILYETANEGEDRRVRRIKIEPDSSAMLTINAKVACKIKIR